MEGDEQGTNPELPEGLTDEVNVDTIKDTVFSKHWALSVLLEFVRYVQDKELHENPEIEGDFHNNLCKLWDMSINENVAIFLMENEYLDILSACVEKSASPRAIEISVGILANMACVDAVREAVEGDLERMRICICMLRSTHSPVLIETLRLLTTCISRSNLVEKWMNEIRESPDVYASILFYFQSSTNSTLLGSTADFVDQVMSSDDAICIKWSTPEFVAAIMEALVQLGPDLGDPGKTFLHILQYVSTSVTGIQALAVHAEKVCRFSVSYLKSVCDEDFIVLDGKENTIASSLAILNATFYFWEGRKESISYEYTLIRCLLKLVEVAYNAKKEKDGKINGSAMGSDDESLTNYIYELILTLLQDTFSTLLQVSLESLQLEENEIKIPKSLEYLETVCDTNRLTFFYKASSNHDTWLNIAKDFNCLRLMDFLTSDPSALQIS